MHLEIQSNRSPSTGYRKIIQFVDALMNGCSHLCSVIMRCGKAHGLR